MKHKSTILTIAAVCTISGIASLGVQQQYADSMENPKVESHTKPINQTSLDLEKAAQEKAEQEKAAKEKAAKEKAEQEQAEQEKAAQEKAAQEQAAQEKAAQEQAEQEKAAQEKAAQEQAEQEKAAQEQAAQEQTAVQTYNITSQYMALSQDQAFIDQNPYQFAENTINGTEYFAGHNYGAGAFVNKLKVGDIIIVNNATKYRVDEIQIVEYNGREAWAILESGVQAVIQSCTDSSGRYDYFDTLSRVD